ncbi:MAG: hypothetical protein HRU31_17065 [Rhodobacteraceae bacterium]|nr:hypothetical protein [Paracoccaceae bacterium]
MLDTIQKPDLVHQTISCGDTLAAHHFACHAARADAKKPGDQMEMFRKHGPTILTQRVIRVAPCDPS